MEKSGNPSPEVREYFASRGGEICLRSALETVVGTEVSDDELDIAVEAIKQSVLHEVKSAGWYSVRLTCRIADCRAGCTLTKIGNDMRMSPFSEAEGAATPDDCILIRE